MSAAPGFSALFRLAAHRFCRGLDGFRIVAEVLVRRVPEPAVLDDADAERHPDRNVITRAVGGMAELYLDIQIGELRHNDKYLLCSDGLYRELNDEALVRSLNGMDPARMCNGLIKQALAGPCRDNVSAVVVAVSAT